MVFSVLPIINFDGKRLLIDECVPIEPVADDMFEVLEPVTVKGQIVNVGGILELAADCRAKLRFFCDRCMEPIEEELQFQVAERFRKEDPRLDDTDQNSDIVLLAGSTIDLSELVYHGLYMYLPSKHLCREDCKGICPQCGMNLNHGDCACDHRPVDPRFTVLDSLLGDD